jgi:hypothetical protein
MCQSTPRNFRGFFQYLYLFPGHFWDFSIFWRIWKIWKFFYFPPGPHPSVPSLSPSLSLRRSVLPGCADAVRVTASACRATAAPLPHHAILVQARRDKDCTPVGAFPRTRPPFYPLRFPCCAVLSPMPRRLPRCRSGSACAQRRERHPVPACPRHGLILPAPLSFPSRRERHHRLFKPGHLPCLPPRCFFCSNHALLRSDLVSATPSLAGFFSRLDERRSPVFPFPFGVPDGNPSQPSPSPLRRFGSVSSARRSSRSVARRASVTGAPPHHSRVRCASCRRRQLTSVRARGRSPTPGSPLLLLRLRGLSSAPSRRDDEIDRALPPAAAPLARPGAQRACAPTRLLGPGRPLGLLARAGLVGRFWPLRPAFRLVFVPRQPRAAAAFRPSAWPVSRWP